MPQPREVTLEQVLDRREQRAKAQRALLDTFSGAPLLCLLVNQPGPIKRTAESDRVFAAGLAALKEALAGASIALLYEQTDAPDTGCEAFLVPGADAQTVKRIACALEDGLPYGRLLDIDVHAPDGKQLSRAALSLPARGCFVCGKPGADCASRRLHPLPALLDAFRRLAATAPTEETV